MLDIIKELYIYDIITREQKETAYLAIMTNENGDVARWTPRNAYAEMFIPLLEGACYYSIDDFICDANEYGIEEGDDYIVLTAYGQEALTLEVYF